MRLVHIVPTGVAVVVVEDMGFLSSVEVGSPFYFLERVMDGLVVMSSPVCKLSVVLCICRKLCRALRQQ